jgi:glutathione S-transferase
LRPWLALRQANIPFEETVMLFETAGWRESIKSISPSGKVPALRHGELTLVESLAICEYIAELHPEAKLWPDAIDARAVARSVSCEMHAGFAHLRRTMWMNVVGRTPKDVISPEVRADVDRVQALWTECRTRFGAGGPFLFGRFSIADAMFAPVVFRFRTYGIAVTEPAAKAWYDAMLELPPMKEWERASEEEMAGKPVPYNPSSAQTAYAVIFTSQHSKNPNDLEGYSEMANVMEELVKKQPGYLAHDSVRDSSGLGITVAYFDSLDAIARWKNNEKHRVAQERGKSHFYEQYSVRVCSVERSYGSSK